MGAWSRRLSLHDTLAFIAFSSHETVGRLVGSAVVGYRMQTNFKRASATACQHGPLSPHRSGLSMWACSGAAGMATAMAWDMRHLRSAGVVLTTSAYSPEMPRSLSDLAK
ncbi:MAG: hypothetical protein JWO42_1240 [Chloroflexi bacterium]|nr:hypothetical protein [Chloroflexota bacterium]